MAGGRAAGWVRVRVRVKFRVRVRVRVTVRVRVRVRVRVSVIGQARSLASTLSRCARRGASSSPGPRCATRSPPSAEPHC